MKIFRSFDDALAIRNPVVTTGSFDGVHIGHKTILRRLKMLAEMHGGESVLITFDPHPRKVLYPDTAGKDLKLINSQEEKIALLKNAGLDNIIIVEFTREFSKVTSEQFVRDYLYGKLRARVVVAGFNHHFGFNKEGDYKQLWGWQDKYSFEAEEIPEQEVFHETVSSTKIRQAISEGYIQRANAYLDHYYIIIGRPQAYDRGIYRSSVLPTLFLMPVMEECKLLPPSGIYAVSVRSETGKSKGMVIINKEPSEYPEVLVHIFDGASQVINSKVTLYFHKKILGAVNLSDARAVIKVNSAKAEITDLIY